MMNCDDAPRLLDKWQKQLKLSDWDIRLHFVKTPWRKTGDIKIDADGRNAVLMINACDPKQTNMEELVIHELLHLKLYGMDQMIEELINLVYGENDDAKREFAYTRFMRELETTVADLAKSFINTGGEDGEISFGRLAKQVRDETGADI